MNYEWWELPVSISENIIASTVRLSDEMNAVDVAILLWSLAGSSRSPEGFPFLKKI